LTLHNPLLEALALEKQLNTVKRPHLCVRDEGKLCPVVKVISVVISDLVEEVRRF
jgi:hypothetical protein